MPWFPDSESEWGRSEEEPPERMGPTRALFLLERECAQAPPSPYATRYGTITSYPDQRYSPRSWPVCWDGNDQVYGEYYDDYLEVVDTWSNPE